MGERSSGDANLIVDGIAEFAVPSLADMQCIPDPSCTYKPEQTTIFAIRAELRLRCVGPVPRSSAGRHPEITPGGLKDSPGPNPGRPKWSAPLTDVRLVPPGQPRSPAGGARTLLIRRNFAGGPEFQHLFRRKGCILPAGSIGPSRSGISPGCRADCSTLAAARDRSNDGSHRCAAPDEGAVLFLMALTHNRDLGGADAVPAPTRILDGVQCDLQKNI